MFGSAPAPAPHVTSAPEKPEPHQTATPLAPGHLQEELKPFLGCIGGAANSSSAALAPAPHVEPSARSPPKHGLSGIAFACRIVMVVCENRPI